MMFLLSLVLFGFCGYQLWLAYSGGRIAWDGIQDIKKATRPRLFWFAVVWFAFCMICSVCVAIMFAPR